jgi:hypothetical protein
MAAFLGHRGNDLDLSRYVCQEKSGLRGGFRNGFPTDTVLDSPTFLLSPRGRQSYRNLVGGVRAIPDPDGVVPAGAGQALAVGAEGHAVDPAGVPLEGEGVLD